MLLSSWDITLVDCGIVLTGAVTQTFHLWYVWHLDTYVLFKPRWLFLSIRSYSRFVVQEVLEWVTWVVHMLLPAIIILRHCDDDSVYTGPKRYLQYYIVRVCPFGGPIPPSMLLSHCLLHQFNRSWWQKTGYQQLSWVTCLLSCSVSLPWWSFLVSINR